EFITVNGNAGIIYRFTKKQITDNHTIKVTRPVTVKEDVKTLKFPWDIFQLNDWAIRQDFALIKGKRKSEAIPKSNKVVNAGSVFLEKGAHVQHCVLNASSGPVYIGKDAEVMEGSAIRGPFALGEGASVRMNSRIYGATSIGPYSIAGGEFKNSVLFVY